MYNATYSNTEPLNKAAFPWRTHYLTDRYSCLHVRVAWKFNAERIFLQFLLTHQNRSICTIFTNINSTVQMTFIANWMPSSCVIAAIFHGVWHYKLTIWLALITHFVTTNFWPRLMMGKLRRKHNWKGRQQNDPPKSADDNKTDVVVELQGSESYIISLYDLFDYQLCYLLGF